MCGIVGFLHGGGLDDGAAAVTRAMASAIAHRGPDDSGIWIDSEAGVALGHRRLAIVDLSPAGHQPMVSASGRFVITYNGEIYNFGQLRGDLEEAGAAPAWSGTSDTEVLLAAIDHWGVREALGRLNGMFAFGVWDRQRRILTLARDRLGEKPLYYGSTGGAFLFGSELKALRAHPDFRSQLDRDALIDMVRYDYVPAPRTIWQGIAKLAAGHYVEIAEAGAAIGAPVAYWSLRDCAVSGAANSLPDGPELAVDLEALVKEAIGMRMIADVPLGAFLSGGIDSSLIVALMQAQSSRPVKTFTIGFAEEGFDEAPQARRIANYLGTDHTELYVTSRDAMDVIPRLPEIWDEPFGDSSQIPTFLISQLSRQSITVALSGDGGDELFGGYSRYRKQEREWGGVSRLPVAVRKALSAIAGMGSQGALIRGPAGRAAKMLGTEAFEDLYRWRVSRVDHAERLVRGGSAAHGPSAFGALPFLTNPVDKMMYADTLTYLPEDILTKVDRASMAVSLEVRAPFLDHRIVEYAWRLPMAQRLGPIDSKAILRTIGRRLLPPQVLEQPKMGFCLPVEKWVRGPLRTWGEDLLSEDRLARQQIFDVAAVRQLWHGFLAGKKRHDNVIWNLLMFQAWMDTIN